MQLSLCFTPTPITHDQLQDGDLFLTSYMNKPLLALAASEIEPATGRLHPGFITLSVPDGSPFAADGPPPLFLERSLLDRSADLARFDGQLELEVGDVMGLSPRQRHGALVIDENGSAGVWLTGRPSGCFGLADGRLWTGRMAPRIVYSSWSVSLVQGDRRNKLFAIEASDRR